MYPSREEAERILASALECNPGPWGNHSRVAAVCAERIASQCDGMNSEKAYILGLLRDIGRKFGKGHLKHVSDGFRYMSQLGYDEAARICLTHSFGTGRFSEYIGNIDVADEEVKLIKSELEKTEFDDYDKLIQLCDCLAGSDGVVDIKERMKDVKQRYGSYPQDKWDKNLELKSYFEAKAGGNIYDIVSG